MIWCWFYFTLYIAIHQVYGAPLQDTGYFWHVSDFHLDNTYGKAGESCDFPVSKFGPFGDGACDSPLRLVQDALQHMVDINSDVDFVLWTGDNSGHIPEDDFSFEKNLDLIRTVTSAISHTFPRTLVIPALGNHDFFPADFTNGTEHAMYDNVCKIWEHWIDTSDGMESCRRGGFYSKKVGPSLRVVVANTILYLIENPMTKNLSDPSSQFEWLEETLASARYNGEKVIIAAHVPPTIPAPNVINWYYPQYQGRYVTLMNKYSDIIVAQHYGHEHHDVFKILQDTDGSSATPVFLAPSVTPLRGAWLGKPGPRHNPGIRLVAYDRLTGKHTNYRQFFTNITQSNAEGKTHWEELYNFQEAYDVPDMSVESLREILSKMSKPWSSTMLKYCSNFLTTHTPDEVCDVEQQGAFWCAATQTDVNSTKKCVRDYISRDEYKVRIVP